jgi:glycosyltransferase involved in cell wall biosynthesis
MKHNVLYIANSAQIGGANRVLTDLVGGLEPETFVPAVVVPGRGQLLDWLQRRGISSLVIPTAGPSRAAAILRVHRIAAAIVARRAAIVHAIDPMCYREASWAARITGARRICHIQFPPGAKTLKWCFRVPPHLAVTCYRGHVAEVLADMPEAAPFLTALPNSVRLDQFPCRDQADPSSPWRFGRRRMVIIVGHLSDIKGHPTFIRAAAIVKRTFPDTSFVALGGETIQPGFQKVLAALADELGVGEDVQFLGWRENVAEIVRAADVFVLPSLKEGLPLAMLEAMATGVPIVSTPVNGIPDVITDGRNGLLVPPEAPDALAAAILKLFADSGFATNMARGGRETIERDYSMQQFVRQMQDMYSSLLRHDAKPTPVAGDAGRARA